MTNTGTPFQRLLGPVSREEFFGVYWQKRSLLIQNRGDGSWPFAFDRNAYYATLPHCAHLKMAFENADGKHKECVIEAAQAERMYEAGNTICATRIDQGDAGLRQYLFGLERELLGSEFHMNGYLSPGGKGFGTHFDYHSVWVLQIEGEKTWHFSEEPVMESPITSLVFPMDRETFKLPWYSVPRPDESTFRTVTLRPGDLLYLPTGAWHKTRANGYSLSVTLGHEPVQAAKYLTDFVMAGIWTNVASRRHLPPVLTDDPCEGASEDDLRAAFEEALDAMRRRFERLTPDVLMQAWKQQAEHDRRSRRQQAGDAPTRQTPPLLAALARRSNGKVPV